MSKHRTKRRYRARKAARNLLRRYPFLKHMPSVRAWLEPAMRRAYARETREFLKPQRHVLIAAGRRGGKTALMQETIDRLRRDFGESIAISTVKPGERAPFDYIGEDARAELRKAADFFRDLPKFSDMQLRTLREGQEAKHVPTPQDTSVVRASILATHAAGIAKWCDKQLSPLPPYPVCTCAPGIKIPRPTCPVHGFV